MEALLGSAKDLLRELIEKMGFDATVDGALEEDGIRLDVDGPDSALLIGRKGQTLDAIQFLMSRMVSHAAGDRVPLLVDVEGYRARRDESLTAMAQKLADEAVKLGKVITFDPMTPRERRVIHMALSDRKELETKSQGEGADRRVQIIPLKPR
jgi:spoIIIJ-associated protein